ncbi:hypothetical protein BH23BAC1_BH23BAC1_36880 [soil metagenome]
MNERPEETKKKNNRNILIIAFLAILVIINGVKFYIDYQKDQEQQAEIASKNTELEETYNKLESISNELDLKIEEIKKLGGDVEELTQARNELEKEKEQLRKSNNATIASLRSKVSGYEELLKKQDAEIARLKLFNEELLAENTQIKTEKVQLSDSISQLSRTRKQLAQKVEVASQLKAENIMVQALNNRGKAREDEFRNRQLDKLRVEFSLADNKVAPIEGKDIKIRIIDPEGNTLFDVATGAGTFMYNGKEEFYTANQEILFDNTRQKLAFEYDKGGDYAKGTHNVEIFADNYLIGKKSFTVK